MTDYDPSNRDDPYASLTEEELQDLRDQFDEADRVARPLLNYMLAVNEAEDLQARLDAGETVEAVELPANAIEFV